MSDLTDDDKAMIAKLLRETIAADRFPAVATRAALAPAAFQVSSTQVHLGREDDRDCLLCGVHPGLIRMNPAPCLNASAIALYRLLASLVCGLIRGESVYCRTILHWVKLRPGSGSHAAPHSLVFLLFGNAYSRGRAPSRPVAWRLSCCTPTASRLSPS